MWASSAADTRACSRGVLYIDSQKITHTKPRAPVARNAACQPNAMASQGTVAGASTAPTAAPELKRAVEKARSFLGNHSATTLMQAGKLADSPMPSRARATPNMNALRGRRMGDGSPAPHHHGQREAPARAQPVDDPAREQQANRRRWPGTRR